MWECMVLAFKVGVGGLLWACVFIALTLTLGGIAELIDKMRG